MAFRMRGFRVLLILVLAALMDLGSPVLPEAQEGLEEFGEAAYGRRRLVRLLAPGAVPDSVARVATATLAPRRAAVRRSPARTIAAPKRKIPPRLLDPSSASDDH
jgi:hypothetical protein